MEVVLRPANDAFFREFVFPTFELGLTNQTAAMHRMLSEIDDEDMQILLDLALEELPKGSTLRDLRRDDRWTEIAHRLLFRTWFKTPTGWRNEAPIEAFAAPWEESFHLALMLDDSEYPYFDEKQADEHRRTFWTLPRKHVGLASLMCGAWDPLPSFPPGLILTAVGNGLFQPRRSHVRADWAWRPMVTVNEWAARMPSALSRLLDREVKRLHPIEPPERFELMDYWLGRIPEPPLVAVAFSGLGPRTQEWLREIGEMARLVRHASSRGLGLTAFLTRHGGGNDSFGPI